MSKFDTENTTLGQGVWNLKSSPVVYQLDARFWFKAYKEGLDHSHPNFCKNIGVTSDHFEATACLFDPSTVEVVLNPNVFPSSLSGFQARWMGIDLRLRIAEFVINE